MAKRKVDITESNSFYFYSLELKGINCFKENQILDLSNGKDDYSSWTIILGDNGTGKTTLLRAIDNMQPTGKPFEFNNQKLLIPKYLTSKKNEELLNDLKTISIKLKYINNKKIKTLFLDLNSSIPFYLEEDKEIFLLSYGASRRMSKSKRLRSSVSFNTSSLFDDEIELINAEEWFLQKETISDIAEPKAKNKFKKDLNFVKNLLIDILPDVFDIGIKPVNEENPNLLIQVLTSYGWVNLRDLSFGYQTLTALIVDIASNMMDKYPASTNPLGEPVIVLIDEIDLHLHPKWQRTVIDKLSFHFPKAQFIVTAHSPLIVQAAQDRNANIVVCRKEGDRVIIDNNPESVKGWRIDQILTSDLFEVSSSQSIDIEKIRDEKINILLKNELSDSDKKRLEIINKELNSNPVFSNKEAIDAENLIKKAAELLKK